MRPLNRRLRQSSRIGTTVLVLAIVCLVIAPAAVLAAAPHRLAGPITDDVSALSGSTSEVQAAFNDLQDATGTQLWVWFTDTLGGEDQGQFATDTAQASGLGPTDLLLVIALDDRAYGYWKGDGVGISDAGLEDILSQDMEAGLRAADYTGAIDSTATALKEAMTKATAPPETTPAPGATEVVTPGGDSTGGTLGTSLADIVAATLILGGALLVGGWLLLSARRRAGSGQGSGAASGNTSNDPNADLIVMSPKDLEELANRILVETDDAIRDSDQELGFAQAQFGDDAAAPFVAAIAGAKDDIKGAFTIRQRLDDEAPEDAPTHRQMLIDLVVACRKAQDRLHAETHRFDELRALEKEAPGILAGLPAKADALEARLPAAQTALSALGSYADADWQAVASNVDNARTRIAAVREAAVEGTKALAGGTPGIAAHAARLGEDGLAQGTAYLDAIDHLAADLEKARSEVDAELATAEAELAKAKTAAAGAGPADPDIAKRLAEADQLLVDARTALDPPKPDVTGAYDKARRADALADAIEASIRSAQEQRAREAARLQAGLSAAQAAVTRASDYIGGQRGGIGTEARTRVAEAGRHLQQAVALGPTDSAGALAEADTATRLATEAERLAQQDYGRWNDPFHGGGGGGSSGGSGSGGGSGGSGGGSDVAGAIIGGIIGSLLAGGGRRGGGFGGPFGGGLGGGFGGHGGGGGFGGFGGGGGGFGGFGGSSGGGSFGGGGGSHGGGRW